MNHRFAVSPTPGIERCRCGTERELYGDREPFWWYRGASDEGREGWDCPLWVPA